MPQPKEIVTLAHADMVRQLIDLESFVTACYARFDLAKRQILLVDCGHTGMMVLRGNADTCDVFHGDNLPLGIREGEVFEQTTVPFDAGDLFLFYSDGITDVRGPAGEHYGVERLAACVRRHRNLEPQALIEQIREVAVGFGGTDRFADDLTCVAVKIVVAPRPLHHAEMEMDSRLDDLSRARAFVRRCCSAPDGWLEDSTTTSLELAVNEAVSNIIKHAYHGRADQSIQLEADIFPDRVSIRLHHLGDSFDPAVVPPPAFDGSRESGFGLYLIAHSVDEVRYSRDDRGRNCITLVKARQP
jgi:sigma-B regulation protein RsbU (phosphoserine phosphatase)